MMRTKGLVLALLLGAAPVAAQVRSTSYRYEFTPTVSYLFGGTLAAHENALVDADLKVEPNPGYGFTFDIPVSSSFQIELLAQRQPTELTFAHGLFGASGGIADLDLSYYHVGLLWQGRDPRVSPFFVVSAGVTNLNPDVPGASSDNRFSVSIGGGVKVFLSDSVGLRFEGRGFVSDIDAESGGSRDRCYSYDYYYDNCYRDQFSQGQASVGLIFAW